MKKMRDNKEIYSEIKAGLATENDMTWEDAADLMRKNKTETIFDRWQDSDTAFRDMVFEGIAEHLGMTWSQFAKWANKVQSDYQFFE